MIYIDLHFNAVVVGDKVSWITSSQSFAIPRGYSKSFQQLERPAIHLGAEAHFPKRASLFRLQGWSRVLLGSGCSFSRKSTNLVHYPSAGFANSRSVAFRVGDTQLSMFRAG